MMIIMTIIIVVDIFTQLYKFHLFKGWEQGVIGMKKGGKRLIAIPSSLAYGEKVCGQHKNYCKTVWFVQEVLFIYITDS